MSIKAIETSYKNYRFRSRLEARWAVFFDALGIRWEYEKEGYQLPSGSYLPDFFIPIPSREYPKAGLWVEIKGFEAIKRERQLLDELCQETKHTSYLMQGMPFENKMYMVHHSWKSGAYGQREQPKGYPPAFIEYSLWYFLTRFDVADKVDAAIAAARSARFEHGESPR
jgi:hypothetical protein